MNNTGFISRCGAGAACALFVVAAGGGCVSYRGQQDRDAHSSAFLGALRERGEAVSERALSLDDCVALALQNNYDVQMSELDSRLAKLGRNVSFSQFLPQVSLGANAMSWDKTPMMQDKSYQNANVSIGMPLIVPSVWFVYASNKEKASQVIARANFIRQHIGIQTATAYYNCLVSADEIRALEAQVRTARETESRVLGLREESLARDWEAAQASAQRVAREAQLAGARRNAANRKGALLSFLGLPPESEAGGFRVVLNGDIGALESLEGGVEELVLRALSVHPELEIADREVVVKENEVRQAIADFLPNLSLAANLTWTSDNHSWTANRSSGLAGAWNLFDGFANVALYRYSKVERTKAMLAREQTFLRVMLDVMVARHAVEDARDSAAVLENAFVAAKLKYEDYAARCEEGLIPLSDALDAQAVMSEAELHMLQSKYQERTAWAALKLAMGVGDGSVDSVDTVDTVDSIDTIDSIDIIDTIDSVEKTI